MSERWTTAEHTVTLPSGKDLTDWATWDLELGRVARCVSREGADENTTSIAAGEFDPELLIWRMAEPCHRCGSDIWDEILKGHACGSSSTEE